MRMLLPGDPVPASALALDGKKSLKVGPGLWQSSQNGLTATLPGALQTAKSAAGKTLWIENTQGRYVAYTGDLVIATVHHLSAEVFHCTLTAHAASMALLPQLAFENVNKKTRPMLKGQALVYARVSASTEHGRRDGGVGHGNGVTECELTCVNLATGKADGMGELKGGMVFDISLAMARRLMTPKMRKRRHGDDAMSDAEDDADDLHIVVLEELSESMEFEVAVGKNGRVWVKSGRSEDGAGVEETNKTAGQTDSVAGGEEAQRLAIIETITVGRALQETDEGRLTVADQRKLVKRLLSHLHA